MRAFLTAVLLCLLAAPAADASARLDRGFAAGKGWRTLKVGAHESGAQAVLRTRAGKLLVGGFASEPRTYDAVLGFARLHPSGRLDRSFGRGGRALVDPGATGEIVAMNERPDGKVLIAFSTYDTDPTEFRVARLRRDGRLDRGYGHRGVARVALPGEGVALADMAVLPGGSVVLAGTARPTPLDVRVVLTRFDPDGRSFGADDSIGYDNASAVALVRTRGGHLTLVAARPRAAGRPAKTIVAGLGTGTRREIEGARAVDAVADRRSGLALLLAGGGRWGVRRFSEELRPRRAPASLTSTGRPTALAIAPASHAWVALAGGRVAHVRPDGRLSSRSRPPRTRYMLDTTALATMPRGRVAAAGRAFPEDLGDIREDYGPAKMFVARFAR